MGIAGYCLYDKKGTEVYTDTDSSDKGFSYLLALTTAQPSLTLKTDYWGYFQRAYESVKDNKEDASYWEDYNVYLFIAGTAGLVGILWFIGGIVELRKFLNTDWNLTICVSLRSNGARVLYYACLHSSLDLVGTDTSSTKFVRFFAKCHRQLSYEYRSSVGQIR